LKCHCGDRSEQQLDIPHIFEARIEREEPGAAASAKAIRYASVTAAGTRQVDRYQSGPSLSSNFLIREARMSAAPTDT